MSAEPSQARADTPAPSRLAERLQALVPGRPLSSREALSIAELQATRLLALADIQRPPVPEGILAQLLGVRVRERLAIPASGLAARTRRGWVIVLRRDEPVERRRFSCAHEFKHILDDPFVDLVYGDATIRRGQPRTEAVCDFFAGCLLMPRAWLKRDWGNGWQRIDALAGRYRVSRAAMRVRLWQVGLLPPGLEDRFVEAGA